MMKLFPGSFKPSRNQIVVSFLVIVYIAINIFGTGGDDFVIILNNNIVIPLALGVTLIALMLSRRIGGRSQNRLLWWGLTIGWALWTVAQLWWGIAAIIGQAVPYPSWADFFWLAGYIPMYIALWTRIRSLPRNINPAQRTGIWVSILLFVGWTVFFVLVPIVKNNDPTAVLESILNILYPVVDLVLLILVLRILFTYQQGLYGRAWVWISAGFVLTSISDLIFSSATTAGLYYPLGKLNLLSTIGVDVPYNLGYLFWFIGLFIVWAIQRSHHAFAGIDTTKSLVPNTHLFVSTKADDTVINVSQNYSRVFPDAAMQGKTISELFGVSPNETNDLLTDIKAGKVLKERAFMANTLFGQQQIWISGMAVANPQGEYSGAMLLLRMFTDNYSFDELLTEYQKDMVRSLMSKTGTKQKEEEEIKQLISNYYRTFLQAFYNRIIAEGGSILADAFLAELQSVATQNKWEIRIHPDILLDVSTLSRSETLDALPVLYETANQFIIRIIDESTANKIIQDVHSNFDKSTLKNISHFESAKKERT